MENDLLGQQLRGDVKAINTYLMCPFMSRFYQHKMAQHCQWCTVASREEYHLYVPQKLCR